MKSRNYIKRGTFDFSNLFKNKKTQASQLLKTALNDSTIILRNSLKEVSDKAVITQNNINDKDPQMLIRKRIINRVSLEADNLLPKNKIVATNFDKTITKKCESALNIQSDFQGRFSYQGKIFKTKTIIHKTKQKSYTLGIQQLIQNNISKQINCSKVVQYDKQISRSSWNNPLLREKFTLMRQLGLSNGFRGYYSSKNKDSKVMKNSFYKQQMSNRLENQLQQKRSRTFKKQFQPDVRSIQPLLNQRKLERIRISKKVSRQKDLRNIEYVRSKTDQIHRDELQLSGWEDSNQQLGTSAVFNDDHCSYIDNYQ